MVKEVTHGCRISQSYKFLGTLSNSINYEKLLDFLYMYFLTKFNKLQCARQPMGDIFNSIKKIPPPYSPHTHKKHKDIISKINKCKLEKMVVSLQLHIYNIFHKKLYLSYRITVYQHINKGNLIINDI